MHWWYSKLRFLSIKSTDRLACGRVLLRHILSLVSVLTDTIPVRALAEEIKIKSEERTHNDSSLFVKSLKREDRGDNLNG